MMNKRQKIAPVLCQKQHKPGLFRSQVACKKGPEKGRRSQVFASRLRATPHAHQPAPGLQIAYTEPTGLRHYFILKSSAPS